MGAVTLTTGFGSTFAAYDEATGRAYFGQRMETFQIFGEDTRIVEVLMNAGDAAPTQGATLVLGGTEDLLAGHIYNSKLYVVEDGNPFKILTINLPAFASVSNTYPVPDNLGIGGKIGSALDHAAGIMYVVG